MSKVYQLVTDRIIQLLESGTVPWCKNWGAKWQCPQNLTSKKRYRGINVFLLGCQGYDSPYWLTFKQAQSLSGHVRKGEKGTPIVFWTEYETKDKETGEPVTVPCLRYYTGFNVSQCDDIPSEKILAAENVPSNPFTLIERCERVVAGFDGPEIQGSVVPESRSAPARISVLDNQPGSGEQHGTEDQGNRDLPTS